MPGIIEEMAPHTLELLKTFNQVLGLPPVSGDITEDPLLSAGPNGGAQTVRLPDRQSEDTHGKFMDEAAALMEEKVVSTSPAPEKRSPRKPAGCKASVRKTTRPATAKSAALRKPAKTSEEPAE